MADQELRELLEKLHQEIEKADTVDEKGQELLQHLGKDFDSLLERSKGGHLQVHPSTIQRMETTIEY
ncbi:MAG TPA: hypothetical protein VF823_00450, partial [Anaerolineales bacterium]